MNTKRRTFLLLSVFFFLLFVFWAVIGNLKSNMVFDVVSLLCLVTSAAGFSMYSMPEARHSKPRPQTVVRDLDITFTTDAPDTVAEINRIITELQDLSDRLRP